MVDDSLSELTDRDARKDNLIVFNLPKSLCDEADDRKLYDLSLMTELIESELDIKTIATDPVRMIG